MFKTKEQEGPGELPGPSCSFVFEKCFLCFLFAQKALYSGATDRAGSFHGMPTIFHGHLFRVLHLSLLFALDTVRFGHILFLSS